MHIIFERLTMYTATGSGWSMGLRNTRPWDDIWAGGIGEIIWKSGIIDPVTG